MKIIIALLVLLCAEAANKININLFPLAKALT